MQLWLSLFRCTLRCSRVVVCGVQHASSRLSACVTRFMQRCSTWLITLAPLPTSAGAAAAWGCSPHVCLSPDKKWLRHSPLQGPRAHYSFGLRELWEQEDDLFSVHFLGSASDVSEYPTGWCCPFLPSPLARIERLLEMLSLDAHDHVLDLGCGDGRVLVLLSQRSGCCATGVDIDQGLIDCAATRAKDAGVDERVSFVKGDATQQPPCWTNPSRPPVTLVCLFLVPAALEAVSGAVRDLHQHGATVVTMGYHFAAWAPTRADFAFGLRVFDPPASPSSPLISLAFPL